MSIPKGYLPEAGSGLYYRAVAVRDPSTGAQCLLVSRYNPQTGAYTQTIEPMKFTGGPPKAEPQPIAGGKRPLLPLIAGGLAVIGLVAGGCILWFGGQDDPLPPPPGSVSVSSNVASSQLPPPSTSQPPSSASQSANTPSQPPSESSSAQHSDTAETPAPPTIQWPEGIIFGQWYTGIVLRDGELVKPSRPQSLFFQKNGAFSYSYYYSAVDSGLLEGTVSVEGNRLICTTLEGINVPSHVADELPAFIFDFQNGQFICQEPDERVLPEGVVFEMYDHYK